MGFIGSFVRLLVALVIFVGVLVLGIIFSPQLASLFKNLPGTVTIGNGNSQVEIPILASIAVSLVLTLVLNLIMLPFRRRSAET
jgi:hypothetical protein